MITKSEQQARLLPKAKMPKPISESKIKAQILTALRKLPFCLFWNSPTGKFHTGYAGIKGLPDISGIVACQWCNQPDHPMPVFLEVKTDAGRLHGDQQAMHDRLRELGAEVFVVRSVREAVDAVMKVRNG